MFVVCKQVILWERVLSGSVHCGRDHRLLLDRTLMWRIWGRVDAVWEYGVRWEVYGCDWRECVRISVIIGEVLEKLIRSNLIHTKLQIVVGHPRGVVVEDLEKSKLIISNCNVVIFFCASVDTLQTIPILTYDIINILKVEVPQHPNWQSIIGYLDVIFVLNPSTRPLWRCLDRQVRLRSDGNKSDSPHFSWSHFSTQLLVH